VSNYALYSEYLLKKIFRNGQRPNIHHKNARAGHKVSAQTGLYCAPLFVPFFESVRIILSINKSLIKVL
jgi:hypothetical protein